MKLMTLLDCTRNRSYVVILNMYGDVLFTGFSMDVPESFWDREVYLIEHNKLGINIYLEDDNHDHNVNNQ